MLKIILKIMLKIKIIMRLIINNLFTFLSRIYKLGIKKISLIVLNFFKSLIFKYLYYASIRSIAFALCIYLLGANNSPLFIVFQKDVTDGFGKKHNAINIILDFLGIKDQWISVLHDVAPYLIVGGFVGVSVGLFYRWYKNANFKDEGPTNERPTGPVNESSTNERPTGPVNESSTNERPTGLAGLPISPNAAADLENLKGNIKVSLDIVTGQIYDFSGQLFFYGQNVTWNNDAKLLKPLLTRLLREDPGKFPSFKFQIADLSEEDLFYENLLKKKKDLLKKQTVSDLYYDEKGLKTKGDSINEYLKKADININEQAIVNGYLEKADIIIKAIKEQHIIYAESLKKQAYASAELKKQELSYEDSKTFIHVFEFLKHKRLVPLETGKIVYGLLEKQRFICDELRRQIIVYGKIISSAQNNKIFLSKELKKFDEGIHSIQEEIIKKEVLRVRGGTIEVDAYIAKVAAYNKSKSHDYNDDLSSLSLFKRIRYKFLTHNTTYLLEEHYFDESLDLLIDMEKKLSLISNQKEKCLTAVNLEADILSQIKRNKE
jgi:hypothetical protein